MQKNKNKRISERGPIGQDFLEVGHHFRHCTFGITTTTGTMTHW